MLAALVALGFVSAANAEAARGPGHARYDLALRWHSSHDVLDGAVFTRSTDDRQAQESRQIQASLQALARCVAPSGGRIAERRPVPVLTRQACERATCRLGESSVTLSPGLSRTAQHP